LTLDAAVRNLVNWDLATPEQAVRMASQNPRDLMLSAFKAFSIESHEGEIAWSPDLRPREVRIGPVRRTIDSTRQLA
jgi:N-acetylglucosamine-6-phosphate deacetylase